MIRFFEKSVLFIAFYISGYVEGLNKTPVLAQKHSQIDISNF